MKRSLLVPVIVLAVLLLVGMLPAHDHDGDFGSGHRDGACVICATVLVAPQMAPIQPCGWCDLRESGRIAEAVIELPREAVPGPFKGRGPPAESSF